MPSTAVMILVALIIVLIALVIIVPVVNATATKEKIPNKICKTVASVFDPWILAIFGLRPFTYLCDIGAPF
jgi:hypothetical protein